MDWSKVKKEHVEEAIKKYLEEKPNHKEPLSYYLVYKGMQLPSKYIRGMAYSIATGEEFSLAKFSGGQDTVRFFNRLGYTVQQIKQDSSEDKFSVNDAVWIATASMAFEYFENNSDSVRDDMYFRQSDIVKRAQMLVAAKVDSARVSQWTNADNEKHSTNYLRADSLSDSSLRRLSMIDEFPDKTFPEKLNMSEQIDLDGTHYKVEELFNFVSNQYPIILGTMKNIDIDYKGILTYLDNNQELPYKNPEEEGMESKVRIEMTEIKKNGENVVAELQKIATRCLELFGLNVCLPIPWLDGSGTKTRKSLKTEMKYKTYDERPESIVIIAEKENDKLRFRIALDINNDGVNESVITSYHKHLDIKKKKDMVYVSGSSRWGNPVVINDDIDIIRAKVKSGELRKVQISKYCDAKSDKTNEQYDLEIMTAVKEMIPYYEYVIGVLEEEYYWPSTEDYNPGISKEKWLELLKDSEITTVDNLRMFKMMLELGGEATCSNLAEIFGGTAKYYNGLGDAFSKRVFNKTGCKLLMDGQKRRYFTIPFVGRNVVENKKTRYSWKLRNELKEALEEMDLSRIDINSETENNFVKYDKNIILYGPPGTGKTYNTAIYAVAICEGKTLEEVQKLDYEMVMDLYKKLMCNGRIAFTTFHQSYGYEEFIEGIKPVVKDDLDSLSYTVEPGVFKKFCERAEMPEQDQIQFTGTVWNVRSRAGDSDVEFDYEDYLYNEGVVIVEDIEDYRRQCNFLSNMIEGDMVVLGRNSNINAIGVVTDRNPEQIDKGPFHWRRRIKWFEKGLRLSFSDIGMPGGCISNFAIAKSKIKPGNLKNVIRQENADRPYVFIIDEINRGNISKIFGELITLIEDTKRKGMEEEACVVLPYSGTEFSVPSNVYIIGTMNTADHSIAIIDTALRRRFQFIEMMPDADVLRDIGADYVDDLDVAAMLETINERIAFLYDREHTIGHAFFTKLAGSNNIETLSSIFEKSVIPLLQEYFYEDYQKIQLVLGDNGKTDPSIKFIVDEDVKIKNIFKGNAEDVVDLPEKKYRINIEAFDNLESYKQII